MQSVVDSKTGALNIKKGEPWINTFTPLVTYLWRCNSDVTSLLSGTAIKAIVAYISDYVTKPGLKTYSIFDAIRSVFNKSTEMLGVCAIPSTNEWWLCFIDRLLKRPGPGL